MPREHSGRILPHQHETNNQAEILGENIVIENFEADLHETKDLELSVTTLQRNETTEIGSGELSSIGNRIL